MPHEKARDSFPLGAHLLQGGRCSFRVWAPRATEGLQLELLPRRTGEASRIVDLDRHGEIYGAVVDDVAEGDRYFFRFADGRRRPDPRSRRQPEGVHGPSAVVDSARLRSAPLRDDALPLRDHLIYELHVGAFTPAGTFDGVIEKLPYLRGELGVTAIELMPVAPFPGKRNWGYDGVHLYAVQESYGGPAGLARLVQAAHEQGLAVILDVVYNHLGPEGNYLREFGPYFTAKYSTPWGEAINYDDVGSAYVRSWVVENAVQWIGEYRIDGLRLDAIHSIHDASPRHVLAEVGAAVQALGGFVISESDLNDPVTVRARPDGWGHDAQWSDDLHHAVHALLTGERTGYYRDFGSVADVARALMRGFVYDGTRPSSYRGGALHGKDPTGIPAERHVVCSQNHDQVGNRARGDRLSEVAGFDAAKVAAATVLLSPGIPLLFMGEEYGAPQRFPYFTSHSDPELARAVTEGRRREFAAFAWEGAIPDPQAEETFAQAVLQLEQRLQDPHRAILELYRHLIALRRGHPAFRGTQRQNRTRVGCDETAAALFIERWSGDGERVLGILGYRDQPTEAELELPQGPWRLELDGGDLRFGGSGAWAPASLAGGATRLRLPAHAIAIYLG